jgi:hypothetical protein
MGVRKTQKTPAAGEGLVDRRECRRTAPRSRHRGRHEAAWREP